MGILLNILIKMEDAKIEANKSSNIAIKA